MSDAAEPAPDAAPVKNHNKYRRDKPWDHEGIDHWKIEEWKPEFMAGPLLEESSFATLFPQYREQYLREAWPLVTTELKKYGIACELNLIEGSMTVKTTRKTTDPYIILKARDLIKLLSRSIPVAQALRILSDDMQCDIIKISGMISNKDRFAKRRARLVGPDGATLKAIELLTGCYVLVQGNTVSVMGPWKGLKIVRRIVEDCMHNVHPVYHVKALMIKKELEKDPLLKNENWDRFLPKFKHKNVKRKTPKPDAKPKKEYTPFPPANHVPKRKIDEEIESGLYFLTERQRNAKASEEKAKASAEKHSSRAAERAAEFVPPKEKKRKSLDVAATPQAAKTIAELTESLTGSKKRKHAKVKFTEEDEPAAAGSDDM